MNNVKESNTLYDFTVHFKWMHGNSWIKAKWLQSEEQAIEFVKEHMYPQPVWGIEVTHKEQSRKIE